MVSDHVKLALLLLLLLLVINAGAYDMESDREALLAFQDGLTGSRFKWNSTVSPCSWTGVGCYSGRVASLRLPATSLIGQIRAGTIGNLTALRTLSLRLNALSGRLPPDINGPTGLRSIYLEGNCFSGAIPPALSTLRHLVKLNFASNCFSGGIPADFSNLSHLTILLLERNNLSGRIPDLDLPNLTQFNVSYNHLTGSIPTRLRRWPSSAFLGMSHLCGGPLYSCPSEIPHSPSPTTSAPAPAPAPEHASCGGKTAWFAFAPLIVVFIVALVAIILSPWKKKLVFSRGEYRRFSICELVRARSEVLGKGMYGTTYKVTLNRHRHFVVKRLDAIISPKSEFLKRIEYCAGIDDNVLPLFAYYYSDEAHLLLLFYDYMPNRSLSELLQEIKDLNTGNQLESRPVDDTDWERRYIIALGAAKGIKYIHSKGVSSIHGNIKSSNILLGPEASDVRVSEHGLVHLVPTNSIPTPLAGYGAPELIGVQEVSQAADVYSFGVLLLELLTCKDPWQAIRNEGVNVADWFLSTCRDFPEHQEMQQLLNVAKDCAVSEPKDRPSMAVVVDEIKKIYPDRR